MAVHADRRRSEAGVGLTYGTAAATDRDRCRSSGVRAGNKLGKLDEVSSVERKVDDLVGVNDSADDGIFRLGGNGDRVDLNISLTVPTFSCVSTRAVWPTSTVIPSRVRVWKPDASTVTV